MQMKQVIERVLDVLAEGADCYDLRKGAMLVQVLKATYEGPDLERELLETAATSLQALYHLSEVGDG